MIEATSSFPVFIVKDIPAAKAFYTEYLGFQIAFDGEWYIHLVTESGVQLGFLQPDHPTQPAIFHKPYSGEGALFSLEVEDVDKAYAYAKDKSLDIALELISEDWGQKHFCVKDPNGLILDIVESFEPTEEYQADYTD